MEALRGASDFRPRKYTQTKNSHDDVVSQLPDDVLVSILSQLTLKEAARMSILSRRWRHVWKSITRLDFDAMKTLEDICENEGRTLKRERKKYVKCVNRVLKLHNGFLLDEFRVCFDLIKTSQCHIDRWVEYAVSRGVQKLELDLSNLAGLPQKYLTRCAFPVIQCNSLRSLTLKSVEVSGDLIELFIRCCPFLQILVVHGSSRLISLQVYGFSLALRHLEICYCNHAESILVCDTNIVSIVVNTGARLVLRNLPMLVEFSVNWVRPTYENFFNGISSLLSCCFSQLKILTLYYVNSEALVMLHEFPELTRLKEFTIIVYSWYDQSLIGFTSILKASPNLERFIIKLQGISQAKEEREFEVGAKCLLQHLKVVEFHGYYGRTTELELVNYFLENAVSLEHIVIDPSRPLLRCRVKYEDDDEVREHGRRCAKEQLGGLIPQHIKLEIIDPLFS